MRRDLESLGFEIIAPFVGAILLGVYSISVLVAIAMIIKSGVVIDDEDAWKISFVFSTGSSAFFGMFVATAIALGRIGTKIRNAR
jgi:hypothetical protein